MHLRRRGVDVVKLLSEIYKKNTPAVFYGSIPELMNEDELSRRDIDDEAMIADFTQRLNYNYNNLIGGYGTGSMSQRISADEMIYCPMSSVPEGMDFPLRRESIKPSDEDTLDLHVHKLVYNNMNQNTCMITQNPFGNAEGMAVLAENYGEQVLYGEDGGISYSQKDHPRAFSDRC